MSLNKTDIIRIIGKKYSKADFSWLGQNVCIFI